MSVGTRIETAEQLLALPAGDTVLVSEQRNKRFGNRYVMAWQRAGGEFCHHGGALLIDELACSMLRAAEYLPAEIVWEEHHEVTRPSPR